MPIYSVFNLNLASEIPLPELVKVSDTPDVVLKVEKLDCLYRNIDKRDAFRGRIAGLMRFLVSQGREIWIEPISTVDPNLVASAIYGPILTILLRQRGLLVLHGSCVSQNGQAIAFLGKSGTGKSTIAEAFLQKGYGVLTDDVLAIKFESGYPKVIPSIPRVKLWPDSAKAMGYEPETLPTINRYSSKCFHQISNKACQSSNLSRVFVLNRGNNINVEKLDPRNSFLRILLHSKGTILDHPYYSKMHFEHCSSLVKAIPIYSLYRPLDFNVLSDVVEKVMNLQVQKELLPA